MIFLRYILTFFLFAGVMALLFIPVYRYIARASLETELNYAQDSLRSGISSIDAAVITFNNAVIFTGEDPRFRVLKYNPLQIRQDPFSLTELQRTFNSMFLSQSLITDAGIIFSDDVIMTRQRVFLSTDFYQFYGEYLKCADLSLDEWKRLLVSEKPLLPQMAYQSKDHGSYDALTFTAQWYFADEPGWNIMYAAIPVKNISQLIMSSETIAAGFIRIYDNYGNVLLEVPKIYPELNEKYHILTARSDTLAIQYEAWIPESVISRKMQPVKTMIMIFALVSLGFIIIISLIFAYKGSEPMRHLLAKVDNTKNVRIEYEEYREKGKISFLKSLRKVYTDLGESISVVDARLESSLNTIEYQTHLIRGQIFDKALQRGIYGENESQEFLSMFPDFPGQFQMAIIKYDPKPDLPLEETAALQLLLINAVKLWESSVFFQAMQENIIVLILPVSEPSDYWNRRLQFLRSELNRNVDCSLHFSLSDFFSRPQDLFRAWQQQKFIHVIPGIDDLVSAGQMEDTSKDIVKLPINISMPQIIYQALSNGNDSAACAILKECTSPLLTEGSHTLSSLVFDMISSIIILIKLENPVLLLNVSVPQYERGHEEQLFKNNLPDCFREIASKIKSSRENSFILFGRKVLDYINEHLYNPELYSTMVLDHFDISQPTLQKLMKAITGQTFLAYVESRRLEKARQMLTEGNYAIQQVAAECGFSRTDSFNKAFKRTYGFPPSSLQNS